MLKFNHFQNYNLQISFFLVKGRVIESVTFLASFFKALRWRLTKYSPELTLRVKCHDSGFVYTE